MHRLTKQNEGSKESAPPNSAAVRDPEVVAREARELFARWEREDEAGAGEGEPSWEEVKRVLNEDRPPDGKPFPEDG